MLDEPMLEDENGGPYTVAEYLSFYGDGSTLDGCLCYNYGGDGYDVEYLRDLIPVVGRLMIRFPKDVENLTEIRDYLRYRLVSLKAGSKVPPCHEETFTTDEGVKLSYSDIRAAMRGEPYDMRLRGGDYALFAAAVNRGIDSRLQACFVPERGDQVSPNGEAVISVESFPVLIRRLFEGGEEAAQLAGDMLEALKED